MSENFITKPEVCPTCGDVKRVGVIELTCDGCGKKLVTGSEQRFLDVHEHNEDTEDDCGIVRRHFCNWGCLFNYLPRAKYSDCIGLPYIRQDMAEFLEAAKKGGAK